MRLIAVLAMMAVATCHVFALPSSHYAASSKLASGKWAKVQVAESGMQLISNSTLKNLGFSDPDKVNVYGYGGRMLPEQINSATPDDLPAIPSVRTPAGLSFSGMRVSHGRLLHLRRDIATTSTLIPNQPTISSAILKGRENPRHHPT